MEEKIETTLDRLRIEAMERGMSFEAFTAAIVGSIAVIVQRGRLTQTMARGVSFEGTR